MTIEEALEKIWESVVDNRAFSETLSDIVPYCGETIPTIMDYEGIGKQHDEEPQKISPYLYLKG